MPTAELPDPDDAFAALMEDVDIAMPTDVVNVALLDEVELNKRFTQVKQALYRRGEMINPTTATGRDLHSERAAYIVEMRRRGMLD